MNTAWYQVPQCPKCKRDHSLMLIEGLRIQCVEAIGGCGQVFDVWGIAKFYRQAEAVPVETA